MQHSSLFVSYDESLASSACPSEKLPLLSEYYAASSSSFFACRLAHVIMLVSGRDGRPSPRMTTAPPSIKYLQNNTTIDFMIIATFAIVQATDSTMCWRPAGTHVTHVQHIRRWQQSAAKLQMPCGLHTRKTPKG
jgi:hypothetical protein